jgi:hypothetical protein
VWPAWKNWLVHLLLSQVASNRFSVSSSVAGLFDAPAGPAGWLLPWHN